MSMPESPFRLLALAPFQLGGTSPVKAAPLPVSCGDLDGVMAVMNSRLFLSLDAALSPKGGLDFQFDRFTCLTPDGIAANHPFFQHLLEARELVRSASIRRESAVELREELGRWTDLPPLQLVDAAPERPSLVEGSVLDEILSIMDLGAQPPAATTPRRYATDQVDSIGVQILRSLFGDERFRRFESVWLGLRLLLQQGAIDDTVNVCVASVDPDDLETSLEALTPHLIESLPGAILLDLPFDNTPVAMEALSATARWAAALMVPVIAWTPASFFQISSWDRINTLPFIPHHLETPSYAKFRRLRSSEEGRWLCLACNRFLGRNPYGRDHPVRSFAFEETELPWVAPVWTLGTLIARSHVQDGWPTRFNDSARFKVQNLGLRSQGATDPLPVEAMLDHDRLDQFAHAGITPMAALSGKDIAFFPKAVTLSGSSLAYQLMLCRLTQFVLWCKDNLGGEESPRALEARMLNALRRFSRRSRLPGLSDIQVRAGSPTIDRGRIPLHLVLTADARVLPGGQTIELQLDW